jgi:PAS domain S-box-containing protein
VSPRAKVVLAAGAAICTLAFACIRSGLLPGHTRLLDNVYWTVSFATAALLAFFGRAGADLDAPARRWFSRSLATYFAGQVLWALQVLFAENPFPGPSDLLFLLFGPGMALAFWTALRARLPARDLRLPALDTSMLSVAMLVLALALYLPRRGDMTGIQIAVVVLYPVTMLGAASLGVVVVLTLKPRPGAGWPLLLASLLGSGAAWLHWNSLALENTLEDGSFYNFSFAVLALGMGTGALLFRLEPANNPRWERVCDGALTLLPLLLVVVAAASVVVVWTLPFVPEVALLSVMFGAAVVVVLAMLRQSVQLLDRERLLATEQQMRRTEESYRILVESASDGIFIADASGRYLDVNSRGCEMLGYTRTELLQRSIADVVIPGEEPRIVPEIALQLAGQTIQNEWQFRRKDGSVFPGEVSGSMLPDGRLQGIVRDVTERRALEERVRQMQKMEAIGKLSGGVAHDFNNLLTVIQSNVSLLELTPGVPPDAVQFLSEIRQASVRAASLTRQLLTFSRKQVMRLTSVDLSEIVGNLAQMLGRILGEPIRLEVDLQPNAPVRADVGMLEQVLMNLAVNARDALPNGGKLVLRTRIVEVGAAEAKRHAGAAAGAYCRLTVEDDGVGIADDALGRIFDPFFTTKEFGKGTGLGLSTVLGIVEQHKGFIDVITAAGEGTTFHVYFPKASDAPVPLKPAPHPPAVATGRETILLVEDEAPVRKVVALTLERAGYRVLVASNGVEARNLWQTQGSKVALLLTDYVMPEGVSGRALAEELLTAAPSLRVIIMSGYSTELAGRDFPARRGVAFLAKPFELEELTKLVRATLDERRKETERPSV